MSQKLELNRIDEEKWKRLQNQTRTLLAPGEVMLWAAPAGLHNNDSQFRIHLFEATNKTWISKQYPLTLAWTLHQQTGWHWNCNLQKSPWCFYKVFRWYNSWIGTKRSRLKEPALNFLPFKKQSTAAEHPISTLRVWMLSKACASFQ